VFSSRLVSNGEDRVLDAMKRALYMPLCEYTVWFCGRMPTSKLYAQSREPGDGRILGKLGVAPLSDLIFGGVFRVSVFRTKILDLTFIPSQTSYCCLSKALCGEF
jgi:hypothetical protein